MQQSSGYHCAFLTQSFQVWQRMRSNHQMESTGGAQDAGPLHVEVGTARLVNAALCAARPEGTTAENLHPV